MGGPNSGRYGGRPTVESGLTLDLNKLVRERHFRPGHSGSGMLVWTRVVSGEQVGSVAYQVTMADEPSRITQEGGSAWPCRSALL